MCRKRGLRLFLAYSSAESIIMNTEVSRGGGSFILLLREVQTATTELFRRTSRLNSDPHNTFLVFLSRG